jgi:hypothetical protein
MTQASPGEHTMPLEDIRAIDVGLTKADGSAELLVTDSGVTADPTKRLELLRDKLRTYAVYISSREFETDYPGVGRDRVAIRVFCANPPSQEMQQIRGIAIKGDDPVNIPVSYCHFPSPSAPQSPPPAASPRNQSSLAKAFKGIVSIAVVIAVVVGFKLYNKSKASAAVREQAFVLLQSFPQYEENKEYYDSAFDELHGKAFDHAYRLGGRRSSAAFDEEGYLAVLIALYQRRATEDGRPQIGDALDLYRKTLDLPVVEFQ